MATPSKLYYCGSCGRRVQKHQAMQSIHSKKGMMHFHESWEGCYESTREPVVAMTQLERDLQMISYTY